MTKRVKLNESLVATCATTVPLAGTAGVFGKPNRSPFRRIRQWLSTNSRFPLRLLGLHLQRQATKQPDQVTCEFAAPLSGQRREAELQCRNNDNLRPGNSFATLDRWLSFQMASGAPAAYLTTLMLQ